MKLSSKLSEEEINAIFRNMREAPNKKMKDKMRADLVSRLSYIPCSLVGKYRKYQNYEDIKQVAYETFVKAIDTYDIGKGDNFKGWCWWWIRKEVAKQAYGEKKYLARRASLNLDKHEEEELVPSYEDELVDFTSSYLLHVYLDKLEYRSSYILRKAFGIDCEEQSLRAIGADLNLSHETIRKLKANALEKLTRMLSKANLG